MSLSPASVQPLPLSRSILLPASFAASGALLLILFMALVGCGGEPFGSDRPPQSAQKMPVLCECMCQNPVDPLAVPEKNYVAVGSDDASQTMIPGTAALTFSTIQLGQNGLAGVRFQSIGVPPSATITEARIQFTAGATSPAGNAADLHIRVVDQPDALFTADNPPQPIDLSTLPLVNAAVDWAPGPWTVDDASTEQLTPDLSQLLHAIVNRHDYKPTSSVAFVIEGFGWRSARSFEGATSKPAPPFLTIKYEPFKTTNQFAACSSNPNDLRSGLEQDPTTVCSGYVHDKVASLAAQCHVGSSSGCTCTPKPTPDQTFAAACYNSCAVYACPYGCSLYGAAPDLVLPDDCNAADFVQAMTTPSGQYVCVIPALGP